MKQYYIHDKEKNFGYLKVKKKANIGIAAFMLLCLVELGEEDYYTNEKQGLVNFILAMENRDQGFLYPYFLPSKMTDFKSAQKYYPGEAMTALMSLYEQEKDKKHLNLCMRMFDYYRDLFKKEKKLSVSWMSQAYASVFNTTKDMKYANFVFEMNDYIIKRQLDDGEKFTDKMGSFGKRGYSYSTGTYLEGIAKAYEIAKELNDTERIQKYEKALLMGMRFLLQSQYTEENMFTVINKELTTGGMRTSVDNLSIRIDAVQHAAHAMIRFLEALYS